MIEFEFTVKDALGLHARPAGGLVKLAQEFESEGTLTLPRSGKSASLKRLLALMSLAVKGGDMVIVTLEGQDEQQAADAVRHWLEGHLGEKK